MGCFPKTAVLEALEIGPDEYKTLMVRLDELGVVEIRSTPADFGVLFVINGNITDLHQRIVDTANNREYIRELVGETLGETPATAPAAATPAPNWFSEHPGLTKGLVVLVAAAAAAMLIENLLAIGQRLTR